MLHKKRLLILTKVPKFVEFLDNVATDMLVFQYVSNDKRGQYLRRYYNEIQKSNRNSNGSNNGT